MTNRRTIPIHHLILIVIGALLTTATAQEISLYDNRGQAIAYIDLNDDDTIYLFNGTPVAYLHDDRSPNHYLVYTFTGTFIGWYEAGVMWDTRGDGILARAELLTTPPRLDPLKSIKRFTPLKGLRALAPIKPIYSNRFTTTLPAPFSSASPTTTSPTPRTASTGAYSGTRPQPIDTISRSGDIITLLDGSRWEIYFADQVRVSIWLTGSRVTVPPAQRPTLGFDYVLTNASGREARAKFLGS